METFSTILWIIYFEANDFCILSLYSAALAKSLIYNCLSQFTLQSPLNDLPILPMFLLLYSPQQVVVSLFARLKRTKCAFVVMSGHHCGIWKFSGPGAFIHPLNPMDS